jgi:hypothetical protein
MAVAYRDVTAATQTANANWAVSKPTLAAAGDVLLAFLFTDTAATMNTPAAGWTAFTLSPRDNSGAQDTRMFAYWRVMQAGDPASWTWTFGANATGGKIMLAYSGVDQTTPLEAQNMGGTAASTSHATTSVVTTGTDRMIVIAYGADESATFTPYFGPPASFNERVDLEAANFVEVGACDKVEAAANTYSYTYTHTDSDGGVHAIVALQPAAVPGGVSAQKVGGPNNGGGMALTPVTRPTPPQWIQ